MEEIKKIEVQGQQYGVADMLMRSVMGGNAQVIEWSHTHNMNDYKDAGTYRIKGERTGNPMDDNLPIMNQGSGHTIEGILYVLDSSLANGKGNYDDCTVTQFLMLSNRIGGQEGNMYMRSAYGRSKDSLTWKPWEKYQTNAEVGVVSEYHLLNPSNYTEVLEEYGGMWSLTDNGMYRGIYIPTKALVGTHPSAGIEDPTAIETFVMVVINNFDAAGRDDYRATQIKFAVTNGGVFSMEKRSGRPGYDFPQWEPTGVDQQLDGYSKNAVSNAAVYAQFYAHQEEINKRVTKDNLKQVLDWEANTTKEFHIKNRTHHMKDYLCKYFTGSPITISKPSDTGYVVIAYDTDGDAKYLKVKIKANEYKTEEFLDAMGLPIIFTWDNGASTINVQSFSGTLEKLCMRAYYSSSATSFDDYFVKLDEGFLPNGGGTGLPEGVSFDTQNGDKYYFGASDFTNLSIGSGVAVGREVRIGSGVNIDENIRVSDGYIKGTSYSIRFGTQVEIGRNVKIEDNIHITEESLGGMTDVEWTSESDMNDFRAKGSYYIHGIKTKADDRLPINTVNSGASFAAHLTVVDGSLQPSDGSTPTEICVTQFLMLSNRLGGDGNMYFRTYNEPKNVEAGKGIWTDWKRMSGSVEGYIFSNTKKMNIDFGYQDKEVGLNYMVDNGTYQGVYINDEALTYQEGSYNAETGNGIASLDPTKIAYVETFIVTTINDYAATAQVNQMLGSLGMPQKTRQICQFKQATNVLTGTSSYQKRTCLGNGDEYKTASNWSEWEEIGGGGSLGEWDSNGYSFTIDNKVYPDRPIKLGNDISIGSGVRIGGDVKIKSPGASKTLWLGDVNTSEVSDDDYFIGGSLGRRALVADDIKIKASYYTNKITFEYKGKIAELTLTEPSAT